MKCLKRIAQLTQGTKGSLSGLTIHFFKFVIEEVDLLLIVQVKIVGSFYQIYSLRNNLCFGILALSNDLECLGLSPGLKVEALLLEAIFNAGACLLLILNTGLVAHFLDIQSSVDPALDLIDKDHCLCLKLSRMILQKKVLRGSLAQLFGNGESLSEVKTIIEGLNEGRVEVTVLGFLLDNDREDQVLEALKVP